MSLCVHVRGGTTRDGKRMTLFSTCSSLVYWLEINARIPFFGIACLVFWMNIEFAPTIFNCSCVFMLEVVLVEMVKGNDSVLNLQFFGVLVGNKC